MRAVRLVVGVLAGVVLVLLSSCWWLGNDVDTYSGTGGIIAAGGTEPVTTTFPITVSAAGEIREINYITLNGLVHSNSQELDIRLQAPGQFSASLSAYRGTGNQSFDGDYTFVDVGSPDGADTYLPESGDIYETTYETSHDLDDFDGKDTLGTWRLVIVNSGAEGSLEDWSFELAYMRY